MPTSPTPNLTRISQNGSTGSTPRAASPAKLGVPVPSAQTSVSTVDAMGERGMWDDGFDRARRELSVIDEREGSPERSTSPIKRYMEERAEEGGEEVVPPQVIIEEHEEHEEHAEEHVKAIEEHVEEPSEEHLEEHVAEHAEETYQEPHDDDDELSPDHKGRGSKDSSEEPHGDDDHESSPDEDAPDEPTVNDDLSQGSHDDHRGLGPISRVEVTA